MTKRDFSHNPYTKEEVNIGLKNANIVMIDEYKGTFDNVKFKCLKCSYEWIGRYNKVKNYKVCPECRKQYTVAKYNNDLPLAIRSYIKSKAMSILLIEKKGGVCEECKCDLLDAHWKAEYHHTDPTKKDWNVSHLKRCQTWSKIERELSKCQLLCSSCHSKKHYDDYEKFEKYKSQIYMMKHIIDTDNIK